MVNTHQCEIDTLPKINYQANSKKIIDALLFLKKKKFLHYSYSASINVPY